MVTEVFNPGYHARSDSVYDHSSSIGSFGCLSASQPDADLYEDNDPFIAYVDPIHEEVMTKEIRIAGICQGLEVSWNVYLPSLPDQMWLDIYIPLQEEELILKKVATVTRESVNARRLDSCMPDSDMIEDKYSRGTKEPKRTDSKACRNRLCSKGEH